VRLIAYAKAWLRLRVNAYGQEMETTTTKPRSTRKPGLTRTRKLSLAQRAQLVADYERAEESGERLSLEQFGATWGVTGQRVGQLRDAAGVPQRRPQSRALAISPAEKETFIRLWKTGVETASSIAELTGRSQLAVAKYLGAEGLRKPRQRHCA
jgi:hypothetical protein